MLNYYYKSSIEDFIKEDALKILGHLHNENQFNSQLTQSKSWEVQIPILKRALNDLTGMIFFEFSIPRMGKRIDTLW
jgi:hypothetical protein